jgi:ribosome biogenesis GTPase
LLDTRSPAGFAPLAAALATGTSVLVGQSGVGKSSLLNQLIPEAVAATQTISASTEEGRHTTTSAALYHLPAGGELIDSPGVRDFAPPVPEPRQARHGFVEIEALSAGCRFMDCLHREEPGCAVRMAVGTPAESGQRLLTARRYASYRRLLNTSLQMEERRPPGR